MGQPTQELPQTDPSIRPDLKAAIEAMPASVLLGLEVMGFGPGGTSLLRMQIGGKLTSDGVVVQGGLVGTLADFAGVSAAASTLSSDRAAVTTSFQVHNLAPARGQLLIAVGRAVRIGKSSAVSRADVFVAEEAGETFVLREMVATATTTCTFFPVKTLLAKESL